MPQSNPPSSSNPGSWQASIQARLTRDDGNGLIEEITYGGDGSSTKRFKATPGHLAPQIVQILGADQLKALLEQLRTEVQAPPAGVDVVALRVVIDLLEAAIKSGAQS